MLSILQWPTGLTAAALAASLTLGLVAPARAATFPTAFEQYMLELINRARANPQAEVTRLSSFQWGNGPNYGATPDLNEGLTPGTITGTPKPPLAFNVGTMSTTGLVGVARSYAQTLLDNNAFAHDFNNTFWDTRMVAGGYTFNPPFANGENLSVIASSGPLVLTTATTEALYNNLFVDADFAGRGHRINILEANFREIGIGLGESTTYQLFGPSFPNAVLAVQDFASTAGNAFLTGVAYTDTVLADDFYTPGEGLGNALVEVFQGNTLVASTTTWAAGGYSLQLAPGTYDVAFSLAGFNPTLFSGVVFGSQNIKLDFTPTPIPEPSTWALLIGGGAALLGWRHHRRRTAPQTA